MSWHTEYLRPDQAALARIDGEWPYLSSLLRVPHAQASLAAARLANYLEARRAESTMEISLRSSPYHLVLDPSNVCNLACPLCVQATDPRGRPRRKVPLDQVEELLEQQSTTLIRLDLFNWGEPLLHPHFAQIVKTAAFHGIATRTSSNLSLSTLDADDIVRSGLDYLVASVDGTSQETYGRYRVHGQLERVLANLAALVEARERAGRRTPIIEWQYLVLRHNRDEIASAREAAARIGVDVFRFGGARGAMGGKIHGDSASNVRASGDWLLPPEDPLSEYDPRGEKVRTHERERCWWLWGKAALHPDGGIAPCWSSWFERDDLGSWFDGGFDAAWSGAAYAASRRAAAGTEPGGRTVCEICARHRSFVPTPDGDRERSFTVEDLERVANALTEAGLAPASATREALCRGLS